MYSSAEITDILEIRLSKKRFQHSLNVADEARKLAEEHGYPDVEKAKIAGLIHDICKEIPKDEQYEMVRKSKLDVSAVEYCTPPLFHAVAGAWYAENVLNIHDDEMLCAVRYHTVGRADMSMLEKIIYLADLISADRNYKDVNKMRKLAYQSLDKAMLEALEFSITDVVAKGSLLPHHTIEAYNYYTSEKKKERVEI